MEYQLHYFDPSKAMISNAQKLYKAWVYDCSDIRAQELECKYIVRISIHTVLRKIRQIYECIYYLYFIKMLFIIHSAYTSVGLSNIADVWGFFEQEKYFANK